MNKRCESCNTGYHYNFSCPHETDGQIEITFVDTRLFNDEKTVLVNNRTRKQILDFYRDWNSEKDLSDHHYLEIDRDPLLVTSSGRTH